MKRKCAICGATFNGDDDFCGDCSALKNVVSVEGNAMKGINNNIETEIDNVLDLVDGDLMTVNIARKKIHELINKIYTA